MKSNHYIDLKNIPNVGIKGKNWKGGVGKDIFGKCNGIPFRFLIKDVE